MLNLLALQTIFLFVDTADFSLRWSVFSIYFASVVWDNYFILFLGLVLLNGVLLIIQRKCQYYMSVCRCRPATSIGLETRIGEGRCRIEDGCDAAEDRSIDRFLVQTSYFGRKKLWKLCAHVQLCASCNRVEVYWNPELLSSSRTIMHHYMGLNFGRISLFFYL